MGAGASSASAEIAAVSRPQATSVYAVAKYARDNYGIPVLADGGVANSGQMMKALGLGAAAVVCGSMFAGTEEAPGEYFYHSGLRVKAFRGRGFGYMDSRVKAWNVFKIFQDLGTVCAW